ncbi:hypothetical protein IGI04_033338 [Brassica rapa subsp. trilocularis]|uniref:Protein dehydration-induced 19 C-terminal domain-containing protein n=1 Tax=Brassica rapa subsp. trilocularis TaxID=1813537 RepID=A0ABQ7L8Y2_BRACM|nr:hypothetical protein IGI04_033338 [Brassica rapa subsp. trilocularis]
MQIIYWGLRRQREKMTSGRSMLAPSALTTLISTLCCHVGEDLHMDTINGVCPVCAVKVSSDMVAHITLQHSNMKARRGGAQSMLTILKREFPDGKLQSYIIAADPLLSSFISPMAESSLCGEETGSTAKKTNVEKKLVSEEDHREKLKQSEFVQGVFSSMILVDDL